MDGSLVCELLASVPADCPAVRSPTNHVSGVVAFSAAAGVIVLPSLPALALPIHELTALAREVRIRPGPPCRIRFAMRIEIDDAEQPVTTLAIETEVKPAVVHGGGITELVTGFGPENLLAVQPVLGPNAERAGTAVRKWDPVQTRWVSPRNQ